MYNLIVLKGVFKNVEVTPVVFVTGICHSTSAVLSVEEAIMQFECFSNTMLHTVRNKTMWDTIF